MAFGGWPAEAVEFYEGLETDNSKSYWTSHKAVYEDAVLRPMQELTELLAAEFGEPKIFRPYRDIRFSADKTPYKTHIGAVLGHTSYVQFSADGLGAGPACGIWNPASSPGTGRRSPPTALAPISRRSSPSWKRPASRSTVTSRSSPRPAATRRTTRGSACSGTRA